MLRSGIVLCGLLLCAGASRAATLSFSYTLSGGSVLTGMLEGALQGNMNTFVVTSVSAVAFNGIPGVALPFVASFDEYALGGGPLFPTVTVDGSFLDIAACPASGCADGFFFAVGNNAAPLFGGDSYIGGPSFGDTNPPQPYVRANWSASVLSTEIPEPTTGGLIFVSVAAFALWRRKSIAPAISRYVTRAGVTNRTSLVIAALLAISTTASAQKSPEAKRGAESGRPSIAGEFNGDLRSLPKVAPSTSSQREVNPRPFKPRGSWNYYPTPAKMDPLLEEPKTGAKSSSRQAVAVPSTFDTPVLNFAGIPFSGGSNPDTVGDVGTNHYIQMINAGDGGSLVAIFDKTGASLVPAFKLQTLATPGSRCAAGSGDPVVLYDEAANRWLLSEIGATVPQQPNFLCVYISKTGDPVAGGWWSYEFQTVGFPDYPKYGVWPTAYMVGANEVDGPGGNVVSAYALDRSQMLQGAPATFNRFTAPQLPGFFGFNMLTPADLDGSSNPPAGAPGYFLRHVDDEFHFNANTSYDYLEMWALRPNFAVPANATFTRLPDVRVADFDSRICDGGPDRCISQPSSPLSLDSLPQMTMWRLQYRKFNNLETLVGNFTVDATGQDRAGIRWFALNKIGFLNWSLGQQGTHSPDSAERWMGSIAMDSCGNIALGYSVSSASIFPSIRYAGRLRSDAPGTMAQGEHQIIAGASSYSLFNRWGDYTSMNVDPSDGSTFWYTNQYMDQYGLWQTQIATIKFPGCNQPQ